MVLVSQTWRAVRCDDARRRCGARACDARMRQSMPPRPSNLFFGVVTLATAIGVYAVHEDQQDEKRRLREGVIRDVERLKRREGE